MLGLRLRRKPETESGQDSPRRGADERAERSMARQDFRHYWRCIRCGHGYEGMLRLHTCAACSARDRYVLEWTEVTLNGLGVPLPEEEGWEHDPDTGRSRYWHHQ